MSIKFGREICGQLGIAERREWLVTNGIGGYASGTVAGDLTRSYHGLLVAALDPPLQRTLLLSKIDDLATYNGEDYSLGTNRWQGDNISPAGYQNIESFRLEGTIPVWSYAIADAILEKRIWMQPKANTTYVYYSLKRASKPVNLTLKALVNYRSFHGGSLPPLQNQSSVDKGVRVTMNVDDSQSFYLLCDRGDVSLAKEVYNNFLLPREDYRGLNDRDSHLHVATFNATLQPEESLTFVASTAVPNALTGKSLKLDDAGVLNRLLNGKQSLSDRTNYERELIKVWQTANPDLGSMTAIEQLVLAADQFIVDRSIANNGDGKSIIAGYHWFNDWGRDTMISLPGLTLATGRPEIARSIIATFAEYISQGMLPNRFPDGDSLTDRDYNTVDATLWYFEAVRQYYAQTQDKELLKDIFPKLADIVDWHQRGTRYGIKLADDGLLRAGVEGVQLTWMDALVNGEVITPRYGKPIEVNALWYNALKVMSALAIALGKDASQYEQMADKTKRGFARFWNGDTGYCFDVLDTADGTNDLALRPNQIFAVSLPHSPLTKEQQQGVVQACERSLLTSYGLRSLDRHHPQYQGHYGGDQYHRDSAYHQGTVWGWLLGAFALAHLKVYGDRDRALSFLEPAIDHLSDAGLGSISEIFDGDAPFHPRGCIAQAWSVAEVLRAWQEISKR